MQEMGWLVFDLGGVLFDFDGAAGVAELTGMPQDEAHETLVNSSALHALETGEISPEIFGRQFAEELGVSISSTQMLELWASWEAGPKPGSIELLASLGDQHSIACLTNNNVIHWERLSTHYGVLELFQRRYLSHEIGLMKPDPSIFEHVIEDLDSSAAAITYFDDRRDIVDAALACGLNAHQVSGPRDIRVVLGLS
jgi:putative hydrolase of the HAD superfamily